jgi:hypothetical protein
MYEDRSEKLNANSAPYDKGSQYNPLGLSSEDWLVSPWAQLKELGEPTLEQVRTYKESLQDALSDFNYGPVTLYGLITHYSRLTRDERPVASDFFGRVPFAYSLESSAELTLKKAALVLLFMAKLDEEAHQHLQSHEAGEISRILCLQVAEVLSEIRVDHGLGLIKQDDPIGDLEGLLINYGRQNSLITKYLPWILSDLHKDVTADLYQEEMMEFSLSEHQEVDAHAILQHVVLARRLVNILHPSETPHAVWHAPQEELIKLLSKKGVEVDLNLLLKTAEMSASSFNLLKSIINCGDNFKLTLPQWSDLPREIHSDLQSSITPLALDKVTSLLGEYLDSSGQISVYDFFGLRTAKKRSEASPAWSFVSALRELKATSGERLTIQISDSKDRTGLLIQKGSARAEQRRIVACRRLQPGEPVSDNLHTSALRALGAAALITAQKFGTGPYGFCGVSQESITEIEKAVSLDGKGFKRILPASSSRGLFQVILHPPDRLLLFVGKDDLENWSCI